MLIYKILRAPEWQALREAGQSTGAPIDVADGFVHISTGEQVAGTVDKYFAGQADLFVLALDSEAMGPELKWEPSSPISIGLSGSTRCCGWKSSRWSTAATCFRTG